MELRALLLAGGLTAACGSPPEAPAPAPSPAPTPAADARVDPPARPAGPAPYAQFPVVEYVGDGPVLTAPRIVTITFASEDPARRAHFERFGDTITRTPWWTAVSRGYCAPPHSERCVGPGTPGGHVVISEAPSPRYTDFSSPDAPSTIRRFIRRHVASGVIPEPTPQTVYMIYFPLEVAIEVDDGRRSCRGFAGYHSFLELHPRGGTPVRVPYIVLPSCGRGEQLTVTASHELIETAVDPYPGQQPAYHMRDPAWLAVVGGRGEVATLCADTAPIKEGDFLVQRSWNNLAARQGHSPCAPSPPGEVYFNAAPEQQRISLATGESRTIRVRAYADGPVEPWTLSAANLSPDDTTLGFSFDRTRVRAGSEVELTLTLRQAPAPGELAHFYVRSTAGRRVNAWLASVEPRP